MMAQMSAMRMARKMKEAAAMDAATREKILETARETIRQEVVGLQDLSDALGDDFCTLVEHILSQPEGRVVMTGMGKSGHIAKKIAATLASTGTPSFFVHPSEASHGDLGMITQNDTVIALSNSGETAELRDVIAYTRRFGIYLAAFVRRAGSMLVDSADVALVLPATPEANHTNAPTTSTTMMLALGDALATALLERRGFTPEDFSIFHPGGKLGQVFLTVDKLMHTGEEVPTVAPAATMDEVLLVMTEKRFGCAAVVGMDGALMGVITDGDLRRHMKDDLLHKTAEIVMTKNPVVVKPTSLAAKALGIMNDKKITSLFVVDAQSAPVGILHVHDCLRAGVM
jgi:arabinose-5-phosphate isomerase